jgi:hypothetical protein
MGVIAGLGMFVSYYGRQFVLFLLALDFVLFLVKPILALGFGGLVLFVFVKYQFDAFMERREMNVYNGGFKRVNKME